MQGCENYNITTNKSDGRRVPKIGGIKRYLVEISGIGISGL